MDYLQEIKQLHSKEIKPYKGKPRGSSIEEVEALETTIGFSLPEAYKQYLLWMGKDFTGIFQGSDCFLQDVEANNDYLSELLEENQVDFQLPENYLVFFMHQGYMAAWFNLPKESENPETYFFHEALHTTPVCEGSFTDVILKNMKGLAPILPNI